MVRPTRSLPTAARRGSRNHTQILPAVPPWPNSRLPADMPCRFGLFAAEGCLVTLGPAAAGLSTLDEGFGPALHALRVTAVTPTGRTVALAMSAFIRGARGRLGRRTPCRFGAWAKELSLFVNTQFGREGGGAISSRHPRRSRRLRCRHRHRHRVSTARNPCCLTPHPSLTGARRTWSQPSTLQGFHCKRQVQTTKPGR